MIRTAWIGIVVKNGQFQRWIFTQEASNVRTAEYGIRQKEALSLKLQLKVVTVFFIKSAGSAESEARVRSPECFFFQLCEDLSSMNTSKKELTLDVTDECLLLQ